MCLQLIRQICAGYMSYNKANYFKTEELCAREQFGLDNKTQREKTGILEKKIEKLNKQISSEETHSLQLLFNRKWLQLSNPNLNSFVFNPVPDSVEQVVIETKNKLSSLLFFHLTEYDYSK